MEVGVGVWVEGGLKGEGGRRGGVRLALELYEVQLTLAGRKGFCRGYGGCDMW